MFDWRLEARRFAPQLRVLVLQGPQRRDQIAAIAEHDLVITTYPLLARDPQAVLAHCYLLLIGMRDSDDEARQGAETGSGNRSGTRHPDTRLPDWTRRSLEPEPATVATWLVDRVAAGK